MENIGDKETAVNIEKDNECDLDIYTSKSIVGRYEALDDCTMEIVDLISKIKPTLPFIKKLCKIFVSLENYDYNKIVELTKNSNRRIRYVSTYVIFNKINVWCKEGLEYNNISDLYKKVFLSRYKDVDSNIRSLCAEFISNWILSFPKIFNSNTYLKYLGMYLNDKCDIVRKKCISSLIRLESINLQTFFDKNKKRIMEIALYDKNIHIREEGKKLCLILFKKKVVNKEEVYVILKNYEGKDKYLIDTLGNILGNNRTSNLGFFTNIDELHDLYVNTSSSLISKIEYSDDEIYNFVDFLFKYIVENNNCCSRNSNCFLEILKALKCSYLKINKLLLLFMHIKDNVNNVKIILDMLLESKEQVYLDEVEDSIKILEEIYNYLVLLSESRELGDSLKHCTDKYFLILKKLESQFSTTVNSIIEASKDRIIFKYFIIKSFDISIDEDDYLETKIYKSLWSITKEDYYVVQNLDIEWKNNQKVEKNQLLDPKELCSLLIFIKDKIGSNLFNVDVAYDTISSLNMLYQKISDHIKRNAYLIANQEMNVYLNKFNDEGILLDLIYILYASVDEEIFQEIINKSKNKKNLVESFFTFVILFYENIDEKGFFKITVDELYRKILINEKIDTLELFKCGNEEMLENNISSIAKMVSGKSKCLEEGYIFKQIKQIVNKGYRNLYYSICINFISYLNINECIVLESSIEQCKLKSMLSRKTKTNKDFRSSPFLQSENTTFI